MRGNWLDTSVKVTSAPRSAQVIPSIPVPLPTSITLLPAYGLEPLQRGLQGKGFTLKWSKVATLKKFAQDDGAVPYNSSRCARISSNLFYFDVVMGKFEQLHILLLLIFMRWGQGFIFSAHC